MGYLQDRATSVIIPNPDFQGVAAGGKASARIPVGVTYLESWLSFKIAGVAATRAQIEAQVALIRFATDAKEKVLLTGFQAVALAEFYRTGVVGATGKLPFFWRRPWMQILDNQLAPAYGTKDLSTFSCEVTLAAGATIDSITMQHRQGNPTDLGDHNTLLSNNFPFAAAGRQQIFDLPRDPATRLYGLHLNVDPTKLDKIELKADGFTELDCTVADLAQLYKYETSPRTPQATMVHIDFAAMNLHAQSIPMTMNKLELALTWNAAPGNVPIIMDIARKSDTAAAQAA